MAASSAFPPVLSPVELHLDPRSFTPDSGQDLQREPFTSNVVLTDGGLICISAGALAGGTAPRSAQLHARFWSGSAARTVHLERRADRWRPHLHFRRCSRRWNCTSIRAASRPILVRICSANRSPRTSC